MPPQLIAIAGPLKGTVCELTSDNIYVGRDATNPISIPDKSVSRRHCLISRHEDGFKVKDLESRNGTFINGVPVNEQPLKHRDRIKIGNSYFLALLSQDADPPDTQQVCLDDIPLATGSTIRLRLEEVLYSMARDLSGLIKVGQTISEAASLEELQMKLLGTLFELIPAERGAVLLVDESLDHTTSFYAEDRAPTPRGQVRISRTVAQQVIAEGAAILCYDILESEALRQAESLKASTIRSLLCVPLRLRSKVIGIIYLDSSVGNFTEAHLQLASAVAGFAAGTMESVRRISWLESENLRLRADARLAHNMVGESKKMKAVYQTIAKVANSDSTVLIYGESGTGKELVAHALHQNSPRASKPFIALNCAALTETLLESELFGYEKGAFTGALAQTKGRLEMAQGGTLFLDEVGEMQPSLQVKLLRVLQERQFERVGGKHPLKVDIRIISATNRHLQEAIAKGSFREDLFYRLNVIMITMPPLRERREDIPLLAEYFIAKYSERCKRPVTGLSKEARISLMSYDWPGNVRELENVIERAIVLGSTERVMTEDLPESIMDVAPPAARAKYHEAVREAKQQIILSAFAQTDGNHVEAANLLGIHSNNLYRLIRQLNLKPPPDN